MSKRWMARLSLVLMLAAAAVLIGFAGLRSLALVGIGALGVCVVVAGGYWFLANRGVLRWLALALVILAPVAILVLFGWKHLIWVAILSVALALVAVVVARVSLDTGGDSAMPTYPASRPQRAFIVMNPRSGVGRWRSSGWKRRPGRWARTWPCSMARKSWMSRPWPGRRWPRGATCSAWPGVTGPRRW